MPYSAEKELRSAQEFQAGHDHGFNGEERDLKRSLVYDGGYVAGQKAKTKQRNEQKKKQKDIDERLKV